MVPVKTSHQGERRKPLRLAPEPKVGIVWLVDGKLAIDNTLLAKAEDYGAFKVHPGNHCSVWEKFCEAEPFLLTWSTRNAHAGE